jgi:hypothetical protein
VDTVMSARTNLPAMVLVAALLGAIGAPLFAGQTHPACVTKHHECGQTATITSCCCDDQGNANQSGPIESRIRVSADLSAVSGALVSVCVHDAQRRMMRPSPSPLHGAPLDLPTLFASLLI